MIIFEERSPILNQTDYRIKIEQKIRKANSEIIILSAFVKKIGLNWLESLTPKNVNVTIVSRFSPHDILMKATDIEVYEICKKNNWHFKCITELHAKVVLIDNSTLFVGSQNLTGKGMGIVCNPNLEYGMMTIPTNQEVLTISSLVQQSLNINDEIFDEYKNWLNDKKKDFHMPSLKNNPLKKYKVYDYENIWCKDFPEITYDDFIKNFSNVDETIINTKDLFCVDQDISKKEFLENYDNLIIDTKIYNWIKYQAIKNNNEIFFGKLSDLIHNLVRDDPSPNRSKVKHLQANFYSFLKNLSRNILTIDIPYSRSERIVFNI